MISSAIGFTYFLSSTAMFFVMVQFNPEVGSKNTNVYFTAECWSYTMVFLNSLVNPLIYARRSDRFFKSLIPCLDRQHNAVYPKNVPKIMDTIGMEIYQNSDCNENINKSLQLT